MPSRRETGFGSPDDLAGTDRDIGFGSPDDLAAPDADTGFGEPAYITGASLSEADRTVADEGGEIRELTGDFSTWAGPYEVTLIGSDATRYPCYGLVQGEGYTCWPNTARTRLTFVTPPLEPGTYDIEVAGQATETLENFLTVVYRLHHSQVFSLRRYYPRTVMPVGVDSVSLESLLV